MKRFLLSVVLATTLTLTSCQFDDSDIWDKFGEMEESIRDHEQRISALEELCKQMNTNIEALQTLVNALEKRDYVTNVSEVYSNGEVIGYTISFGNSDSITIYHGKDGADGKDGYTPQIAVMKDTDDIYYWTLDGEWLLDDKGNKIQANGVNGTDGTNGSNGTNGTNGVTPQLKIENDYWYVSYDNGATWVQLGKATGEDGKDGQDGNDGADGSDGADGEDGKDGDSIFKSVTQDDEYVYFNLADGTMITLPKHDKENIQFEDLQVKVICCKNWDTNNDGELSYAEAAAVETIGTVFKENTNIIAFTELKHFTSITEIPASAFEGCTSLWKVAWSENVKTIGNKAFRYCTSLTSVTIPDSVTKIGNTAFYECTSLKSVTIGNSVTSIGYQAFSGCTGELIVNCNIPSASSSEYSAFYRAKFTKVAIGNSIALIGDYAFAYCTSLTSITIPNSVTSIGDCAFEDCTSLATITIPDSVTEIGNSAFSGCTGELIINSKIIETDYTSSNYPMNSSDGWLYGSKFTKLTIGNSVTSIGKLAFGGCTSLTSVTISDNCSVTSIGYEAFGGCTSLTSITLPDGVTEIGEYAFRGCTLLKSVTIPDSVTSIGSYAFNNCTSLKAFYGKFASADNRCLIVDGVLNSFAPAGLTEYTIPNRVTSIGNMAFKGCTSLTSVTIPDSVTEIKYHAFDNCTSLTSVTIPDSVTSIGDWAFYDCDSLTSVTIGNSVTSIGDYAFEYCSSLTSVTIPNSVTSIGSFAFSGCTSLTSVTIPDSVTSIGTCSFGYCCNLTSVTIGNNITSIGDYAFEYCSSLTSVTIGDSVTSIGYAAFSYCDSLTSVTIPDSVTSIGASAFYKCTSLTSATIGNGVTSIGHYAFYNCTSLKEVYCKPKTPPTVVVNYNDKWSAFNNNASGRKIYVPIGSGEAYKAKEYWSGYADYIEEKEF